MVSGSWSGSTEKSVKTKVSITEATNFYQLGQTYRVNRSLKESFLKESFVLKIDLREHDGGYLIDISLWLI